jgi:acyl carrier protein
MEIILLKLKKIVESVVCREITDQELTASWAELDLDSLSLIELLNEVEDEFNLKLDYNIFSEYNVTDINSMAKYLTSK